MHAEVLSTGNCGVCDRHAAENGVPSQQLMYAAGEGVAHAIRRRWAPRRTVILCGPGNNGGDGLVAGAVLRKAGWPVRIALLGDPARLRGDAAWASEQWGSAVEAMDAGVLDGAELVIDAVFGAGLNRAPEGVAASVIQAMSGLPARIPVVAVDLPSGLSGDTAQADGPVAAAALTVTFHRCKPAHCLEPGAGLCGEVELVDIGIPDGWDRAAPPLAWINHPGLWSRDLPARSARDHKHTRGRLAVFTGGAASTGAARLAARSGLRAGTGLVTLVSPPSAMLVNAAASAAIMLRRWDEPALASEALSALRADAGVIGPAMGLGETAQEAVLSALRGPAPLVLDADALSCFEAGPDRLFAALRPGDVLTPHEGEFRRLFPDLADGNKIERTCQAAARAGCTVLLKGADTVIAGPGVVPVVSRHASPDLATAGSGDVLAGLIGGLIAQGVSAFQAACMAVWLHGDAGLHLGEGLIAEDLPEVLPQRLQALRRRLKTQAAHSHLLVHGS